jgi:hypothetical protein
MGFMSNTESEKQYLSTGEAAKIACMTSQKIRLLCEQGKLPAVNTSTAIRPRWTIRRCDLEDFLTPSSVKASQAKSQAVSRRQRIDAHVPKVFG